MRASVLLASLLLVTTGCIGMGGDDDPAETNDDEDIGTDSTAEGGQASNSGTNDTTSGDHAHDPAPEKHFVNITGELEGANIVIGTSAFTNETVSIPDTSLSLAFKITAEGGEMSIDIYPPDCEDEPELLFFNTQESDCVVSGSTMNGTEENVNSDGGTFTHSTEDPTGGNWTIDLAKSDAGTNTVSYTIVTQYVDKHKPASDHHS